MGEGDNWREKYLLALDEQERLEREFKLDSELLRKALVRVSMAAEGLNPQLDIKLQQLREALRDKSQPALQKPIDELEEALISYDQSRQQGITQAHHHLQSLYEGLKQLQRIEQLNPEGNINSQLRDLSKKVKQSTQSQQDLPSLLQDLAEVQQQLLQALKDKKPGLWQRLLGKSTEVEVEVAQEESSTSTSQADKLEAEVSSPPVMEGQFQSRAEVESSEQQEVHLQAHLDRPVHEPAFSRISDKVSQVLTDLLNNVEAEECVVQKAVQARQRIERGLNWYELVATLEDIRDLVMQAYVSGSNAFSNYLLSVNTELEAIASSLGLALSSNHQLRRAGERLQEDISGQINALQADLGGSEPLDTLKHEVNSRLVQIQSALADYKRDLLDSQPSLSEQLDAMATRVKALEGQAKQHSDELLKEREKALQDALTGLPNREAYNRRSYMEWQRRQRYQRPLALAVVDIDHFKQVNDRYGHQTGDRVLKVISRALSKRLREADFIARYGGEEFVVLMPETPLSEALEALDKIRLALSKVQFRFKEQPVHITVSIGVSEFTGDDNPDTVFARADKALYRAKESGRNKTCQG